MVPRGRPPKARVRVEVKQLSAGVLDGEREDLDRALVESTLVEVEVLEGDPKLAKGKVVLDLRSSWGKEVVLERNSEEGGNPEIVAIDARVSEPPYLQVVLHDVIWQKLKVLKGELRALHRRSFFDISARVKDGQLLLLQCELNLRNNYTADNREALGVACENLKLLLAAEDVFLKQLAKGDGCPSFDEAEAAGSSMGLEGLGDEGDAREDGACSSSNDTADVTAKAIEPVGRGVNPGPTSGDDAKAHHHGGEPAPPRAPVNGDNGDRGIGSEDLDLVKV
ncbi:hypothetical protein Dimus_031326 [Dionaea muscipula]